MTYVESSLKETDSPAVKRARHSQWTAVSMKEAGDTIRRIADDFPPESKAYPVAALECGRVLAEQICSIEDVPAARISRMDGYAIKISETNLKTRNVIGTSAAGLSFKGVIDNEECVQISTGAIVPNGANAVVPIENTLVVSSNNGVEQIISIEKMPKINDNIRETGSDLKEGEVLLDEGSELNSPEIGILNACGIHAVEIYRKPRVCVISTGNELVEPYEQDIDAGKVRDANRPQLLALFKSQGFKAIDGGIIDDRISSIESSIRTAAKFSPVIVTTGGVSMGEKDYLKQVLQKNLNLKIEFGRVWMKPGLPCTLAHGLVDSHRIVVFALPGNPVSSWVCANLLVTPFLRAMAGHSKIYPTVIKAKLSEQVKLGNRPEYCRAIIEYHSETVATAKLTGNQMSSRMKSLVGANALLILPERTRTDVEETLNADDLVEAIVLNNY